MFCTNCGSSLREGQKFCENCGAPVQQAQAAVQAQPQEQPAAASVRPPVYENPGYGAGYNQTSPYNVNPNARLGGKGQARSVTGCGVKYAITRFFLHYCEFSGRSSRSEYWWPFLMNWAIGIVAGWLGKVLTIIPTLVFLALLLPGLGVFVRREHDIGRSWTRLFVVLIPIVGVIMLLVDMVKPSEGPNRYGPAPIPYSEVSNDLDI